MINPSKYSLVCLLSLYVLFSVAQIDYLGIPVTVEQCENCKDTVNYNYTGDYTFGTQDIVSDFGPRMICGHNFHGGIDYTVTKSGVEDEGYHIYALEGGTIYRVREGGLKYILIEGEDQHNFSYHHIFDNPIPPTPVADMRMARLHRFGPGTQQLAYRPCILHFRVLNNVTDTIVYAACPDNDCSDSYILFSQKIVGYTYDTTSTNPIVVDSTAIMEYDTFFAKNTVEEGEVIATLGTSGNVASHLHLQIHNVLSGISTGGTYSKRNLSDPLEFVEHNGPEFEVSIHSRGQNSTVDNYPQGVSISYPGINEGNFMVRARMRDLDTLGNINHGIGPNKYFYQNTMNLHEVKTIVLHSSWTEGQVIRGPNYEARVSVGGKEQDLVPYPLTPRSILEDDAFNGNWNRTGVDSRAYNTSCGSNYARQWDDYYFADFVTRIHRQDSMGDGMTEIAYTPHNARYPDGPYELYAQVTDVRDSSFYSDTMEFELDNFAPFIDSVHLSVDGQTAYEASWQTTDNGLEVQFVQKDIDDVIIDQLTDEQLTLSVRTTEPVDSLRLQITEIGYDHISLSSDLVHEFTLSRDDILHQDYSADTSYTASIRFRFSGMDISGNSLVVFPTATGSYRPLTRLQAGNADDVWSNASNLNLGTDSLHTIDILCNNCRCDPDLADLIVDVGDCFEISETKVTHALGHDSPTGSIEYQLINTVTDPLIEWDNGMTGNPIENLLPGVYCVTITDVFCCVQHRCDTVRNTCDGFTVDLTTTGQSPSDCNASDGNIRILQINRNGGLAPYTEHWEDQNGMEPDIGPWGPQNLASGTYYYVSTDARGCVARDTIEIMSPNAIIAVAEIYPDCPSSVQGSIYLAAYDGSSVFDFDYLWDDGHQDSGDLSIRTDLDFGTHCVTISSSSTGCSSYYCFDVDLVEAELPLSVEVDYTEKMCPQDSDGYINLTISNGVQPYDIEWDVPTGHCFRESCDELPVGTYCVTVTDYCGDIFSDCIEIEATLSATLRSDTSCYGEGMLMVEDLVSIGDVDYWWQGSTSDNNFINNADPGLYSVFITDETGCRIKRTAYVISPHVSDVQAESACKGFPSSVSVVVDNPWLADTAYFVTSGLASFSHFTEGSSQFEVPLGEMNAGTTYDVQMELGDCSHSFDIRPPVKELEYEHAFYDAGNLLCYSERYCDSLLIDTFVYDAVVDHNTTTSISFGCKASVYCGLDNVGNLQGKKKWYRYKAYRSLLQELIVNPNSPFNADLLQKFYLDVTSYFGEELCATHVRVCEATMEPLFFISAPWPRTPKFCYADRSCVYVDCKWPATDFNFCVGSSLSSLPWWPDGGEITTVPCDPATVSLYQMYLRITDPAVPFSAYPDDFLGSELYHFILDHGGHPSAPCALVSYCQRDYSVIYHNLYQVKCAALPCNCEGANSCDYEEFEPGHPNYGDAYGAVACFVGQGPEYQHWVFRRLTPGNSIFKIVEEESNAQFLYSPSDDIEFIQYSFTRYEGFTEPVINARTPQGYYYEDYDLYHSRSTFRSTDLFYAYEDYDRGRIFEIYKLDSDQPIHILSAESPDASVEFVLQDANIVKCVNSRSGILCHIISDNSFTIDNTTYTGNQSPNNWLVSLSPHGISVLDYGSTVPQLMTSTQSSSSGICLENLNSETIDELGLELSADSELGIFDPDSMKLLAEASCESDFKLLSASYHEHKDETAMLVQGVSPFLLNGEQVVLGDSSQYHLVFGTKSSITENSQLTVDEIDPQTQIHYYGDSSLILALNFRGQMHLIRDTVIHSTNNTWDLVILRGNTITRRYELLTHVAHDYDVFLEESAPINDMLVYTISTTLEKSQSIQIDDKTYSNVGYNGRHLITSHLPIYTYDIPQDFCLEDTLVFDSSGMAFLSLEDLVEPSDFQFLNSIYLEKDTLLCSDGNPARIGLQFINTLGESSSCVSEIHIPNWAEECCNDSVFISIVDPQQVRHYANDLIHTNASINFMDSLYFQSSELLLDSGFYIPQGIQFEFISKPCNDE